MQPNATRRNVQKNLLPRRALELAVGVVFLATLLHTFALTGLIAPVRVSAGSMAPHLLGPHWELECPECGSAYAIGADAPPQAGRTECPQCGATVLIGDAPPRDGDALLVSRAAFLFRLPQRWETIVFRCPEDAKTLCVKRIVGLPGERVSLVRGDVYINGELIRKTLKQQRALRVLIDRVEPSSTSLWRSDETNSRWTRHLGPRPRWTFDGSAAQTAEAELDWLSYVTPTGRPVTDQLLYNVGARTVANPVADLMLSGKFRCAGNGTLYVRCGSGEDSTSVELNFQNRVQILRRADRVLRELACPPLADFRRGPFELEVSLFDQQATVAIDGRVWMRHALASPLDPSPTPFAIAARGMRLQVDDLTLWRDTVYSPIPGGRVTDNEDEATWQLAENKYFVLGDNPAISHDSRAWQHGPGLAAKLIVGRPIHVP